MDGHELSDRASIAQDQLILTMMAEGYQVGAPDGVADQDIVVLFHVRCDQCRGRVHYLPFVQGNEYKPYWICKVCGNTKEF